jgi:hypothetical protein
VAGLHLLADALVGIVERPAEADHDQLAGLGPHHRRRGQQRACANETLPDNPTRQMLDHGQAPCYFPRLSLFDAIRMPWRASPSRRPAYTRPAYILYEKHGAAP